LLSRCLFNLNGLGGGFRPLHLSRYASIMFILYNRRLVKRIGDYGEEYMNVSNKLQITILCSFLIAVVACDSRSTFDSKMSSPAFTTNSPTFIAGVAPPADDYSIRDEFLLPTQKGYVNDFANIFDIKTKEELEQTLTNFKEQAKIDIVIATVRTTGDKTAFDYSVILAKQWAEYGDGIKKCVEEFIKVLTERRVK
jgi:hypothetical protein